MKPIHHTILLILACDQPCRGLHIAKQLTLCGFWSSRSRVYPALTYLKTNNLIRIAHKMPDSYTGNPIHYYELTTP